MARCFFHPDTEETVKTKTAHERAKWAAETLVACLPRKKLASAYHPRMELETCLDAMAATLQKVRSQLLAAGETDGLVDDIDALVPR